MKALWIRVDAHKIDSVEIGRLSDALNIDVVAAFGHYVALGGAVAEHTDEGIIANTPNSTLERWARWTGKRGAFAAAVREIFINAKGEYDDWPDTMGELVKRRARDRNRKANGNGEDAPSLFHGNSADVPPGFPVNSRATERYGTERNGRDLSASAFSSENSNMRSGHPDRDALRAPATDRAAPPASAGTPAAALPPDAQRFVDTFYPADDPKRDDVERQLAATLNGGAKLDKGTRIRAGSVARLEARCRDVIAEGVRKRSSAIVVLLKKLGDTSDDSAPGVALAAAEQQQQQRDEHTVSAELATAERWVNAHLEIHAEIERQLERDGLTGDDDITRMGRRITRNTLLLTAWRDAGEPEVAHG